MDIEHLDELVRSRPGVEAYLEPRTTVTDTTVLLVASSGEWTRRRVDASNPRPVGRLSPGVVVIRAQIPATGGDKCRMSQVVASRSTVAMIVRTPAPVPPLGV